MKGRRQSEILSIIAAHPIETQEQLLSALRERGIIATQATISRDIKELHLVKELTETGGYRYAMPEQAGPTNVTGRLRTIFRESVVSYDCAQNLVVVKTMPGLGSAAGAALDDMEIPDLVGTLAGDDTVLLILRTTQNAQSFCAQMHQLLS